MPPTPARLNTSYRSPTARWTSARAGGCMREGNVAALAGRRTGPDNRGAMPDAPKLSLRVLGPARVTVGGAEAPPPPELLWRKHLALLVYLARSPRKSRTREHLVGLLWSDRDEKQARHSLDRKSIRLNSSHTVISYAVFCLKKRKWQGSSGQYTRLHT